MCYYFITLTNRPIVNDRGCRRIHYCSTTTTSVTYVSDFDRVQLKSFSSTLLQQLYGEWHTSIFVTDNCLKLETWCCSATDCSVVCSVQCGETKVKKWNFELWTIEEVVMIFTIFFNVPKSKIQNPKAMTHSTYVRTVQLYALCHLPGPRTRPGPSWYNMMASLFWLREEKGHRFPHESVNCFVGDVQCYLILRVRSNRTN